MIGYYYFSYTQIPCFALQVHCFPIARSLPRLLRQSKSDSKQCAHNLGYQYQNYKYCYILTLFCCYKGIIVSNSGDYEIYNPLALIYNQWPLVAPVSMVAPTLTTGEFTKTRSDVTTATFSGCLLVTGSCKGTITSLQSYEVNFKTQGSTKFIT